MCSFQAQACALPGGPWRNQRHERWDRETGQEGCQGVPVGTIGARGQRDRETRQEGFSELSVRSVREPWRNQRHGAERQRDKTGRLFRIERAVCQGSLKEQAARRQRDRETEIQGKKAFQDWACDLPGVPEGTSGTKGEIERQDKKAFQDWAMSMRSARVFL